MRWPIKSLNMYYTTYLLVYMLPRGLIDVVEISAVHNLLANVIIGCDSECLLGNALRRYLGIWNPSNLLKVCYVILLRFELTHLDERGVTLTNRAMFYRILITDARVWE